jgi:hypothetical protein
MPTVPKYDTPQVSVTGLSPQRISAPEMPDIAGRQTQAFSEGAMRTGSDLSRIALDQQNEANQTAAKDIETSVTGALDNVLYNPDGGFTTLAGKDVMDGHDNAMEMLRSISSEAMGQAKNDEVKRLVAPAIAARVQNAMVAIDRHAGTQIRDYKIQTAESHAMSSIQSATQSPQDDIQFMYALDTAKEDAAALGKMNGWDADTTALKAQDYADKAWRMRYEAWALRDPVEALTSYVGKQDQISPIARDNIGRQLFSHAAPVLASQLNALGSVSTQDVLGGDASQPRGIRNNNPGNIVKGNSAWQGEVHSNDSRYASFARPEDGLRAMAKTLQNYQASHGLNTIDDIVSRWAPSTENDTASYATNVAKSMGISRTASLDLGNKETLSKLMSSMITQENGKQPYSDAQIATGIAAARGEVTLPTSNAVVSPSMFVDKVHTGVDIIDALPDDWRLHVLQLARAQSAHDMTQARENLRGRLADSTAEYMANGIASNPPDQKDFLRAYGQHDGLQEFAKFQDVAALGAKLQQVKQLNNHDLAALVVSSIPIPGEGFAARQRNFDILKKAAEEVSATRSEDPVEYAVHIGSYGIKPITNIEDLNGFSAEMAHRGAVAPTIARDYGTPYAVMTKPEAETFGAYLNTLQAVDKARVLGQVFKDVGPQGITSISGQLKDKHNSLAIGAMLSQFQSTLGNNAATLYFQGKEMLDQNRSRIDKTAETGLKASIYKEIDGVYQTPQGRDAAADAAYSIYAKLEADGSSDMHRAIRLATGGLMDINGGKIAKPYGWDDGRFKDALHNTVPASIAASGQEFIVGPHRVTAAEFAKSLPGARLKTFGQGTYLVMSGNDVVRNKDGSPFILNMSR